MGITPVRTPETVTSAWRAFFSSLGVEVKDDGIAWPHWRLTGLGDGSLSVRWRIARNPTHYPMPLAHELWEATQWTRDTDLIVIVDRPPMGPVSLIKEWSEEPTGERPNAYTLYAKTNAITHGAYFWTDCPGCGGLAWRVNGWAGGCPVPEPLGDEYVYAHSTTRLRAAYLAAAGYVTADA